MAREKHPHVVAMMLLGKLQASMPLLVSAVALSAMEFEVIGLHGDWNCESGKISGGDSLPGNTASAGVPCEP